MSNITKIILLLLLLALVQCSEELAGGGIGTETNGGKITGLVTQNDKSVKNTIVTLYPADYVQRWQGPLSSEFLDTTDDSGHYSFSYPGEGTYNIEAFHPDSNTRGLLKNIAVTSDSIKDVLVPDLHITKPGTIFLTVSEKEVKANDYLFIAGTSIGKIVEPHELNQNYFVIHDVPSGSYEEIIYITEVDSSSVPIETDIIVIPDDTTNVEILVDTSGVIPFFNWTKSYKIKINTTGSGGNISEDLIDFPLLLKIDSTYFDFSISQSQGGDLRFSNIHNSPLHYQITRWDEGTKQAEIWVLVDTIKGNDSSQIINMYSGNKEALDLSNGSAVFDNRNGFVGVWHFEETGNSNHYGFKDATGNQAHGTGMHMNENNSMDAPVGKGVYLDGQTNYVQVDSGKLYLVNQSITFSAWIKRDTLSKEEFFLSQGNASKSKGLHFGFRESNEFTFAFYGDDLNTWGVDANKEWNHWTTVFDLKTYIRKAYLNGSLFWTDTALAPYTGTGELIIGRRAMRDTIHAHGSLDEIQFSHMPRSQDWIKLNYETQKPGSNLVSIE